MEDLVNVTPAPRTLASLTEAEARECFLVAFDYTPTSPVFHVGTVTCIIDSQRRLCITKTGAMGANDIVTGKYEDFFAVRLVDYLRSIGVVFE